MRKLAIFLSVCVVALSLVAPQASAMKRVRKTYPGGRPSIERVIESTWPARYHRAAKNVAWCESTMKPTASNKWGFKGLFQMGKREWKQYGRGNVYNPRDNSAAAYRYFKAVGHHWGPWECQP